MADRLIQTETLEAIANAIRTKNGESAAYTPAQMVEKILEIATGAKITSGSFTPASNTTLGINSTFYVNHNLGVLPNFFFISTPESNITAGALYLIRALFFTVNAGDTSPFNYSMTADVLSVTSKIEVTSPSFRYVNIGSNGGLNAYAKNTSQQRGILLDDISNTRLRLCTMRNASSTNVLKAGATYDWIVGAI